MLVPLSFLISGCGEKGAASPACSGRCPLLDALRGLLNDRDEAQSCHVPWQLRCLLLEGVIMAAATEWGEAPTSRLPK
jgi:hypothetical protein